jgi:hypothetical protein
MVNVRWVVLGVVVLAALGGAGFVAMEGRSTANPGEQPFVFPHDVHAGVNQIPCMYCHYSADRSISAGIPAVQTCGGCHTPRGAPLILPQHPDVVQMMEHWERGEPIPWNRDHNLPDHVRFTHAMHVQAGVTCQECHGPVEEMREVRQWASLRMGWCVDCHRQRAARTDCWVCHY